MPKQVLPPAAPGLEERIMAEAHRQPPPRLWIPAALVASVAILESGLLPKLFGPSLTTTE